MVTLVSVTKWNAVDFITVILFLIVVCSTFVIICLNTSNNSYCVCMDKCYCCMYFMLATY